MKEIRPSSDTLDWCRLHLDAPLVDVAPLRVEASHRTFYRLHLETGSVVLMCSPPSLEQNDQFAALAELFAAAGIPVPAVRAADMSAGWFLLEDLGTVHLEDAYAGPDRDRAIAAAIDMLPRLGGVTSALIPAYDTPRLQMELGIFTEWLVAGVLHLDIPADHWQSDFNQLIAAMQEQPKGCVHRDYHCRNLLWQGGKLGIVDFQDALYGPCLYDLASLLRDCYFEFSEAEVARWLKHYVAVEPKLAGMEGSQISRWLDFTAIQRQLKAIGIFARLHLRDGKSTHLPHIVPVTDRLLTLLAAYPELHALNEQLMHCRKTMDTIPALARPAATAS